MHVVHGPNYLATNTGQSISLRVIKKGFLHHNIAQSRARHTSQKAPKSSPTSEQSHSARGGFTKISRIPCNHQSLACSSHLNNSIVLHVGSIDWTATSDIHVQRIFHESIS